VRGYNKTLLYSKEKGSLVILVLYAFNNKHKEWYCVGYELMEKKDYLIVALLTLLATPNSFNNFTITIADTHFSLNHSIISCRAIALLGLSNTIK